MRRSGRSGHYVQQPSGHRAFLPLPLPPEDPPLDLTTAFVGLLQTAGLALGRLDGCSRLLPNPDLFVGSFVQKEALLSSQIEGTQASLEDVLSPRGDPTRAADVGEVVNYVAALRFGLDRLRTQPLSLRLIREIHARLMRDVRGSDRTPGEFRRSQNWIGVGATTLAKASFVPPPPHEMIAALDAWERYMVHPPHAPELVKCALLHAQFETIHPFLDGNGRLGRLLITFLLHQWGLLQRPILYLSLWFKSHRVEYYERLQAIRDRGEWEEWVEFFLKGIAETSDQASAAALSVVALRQKHLEKVRTRVRSRRAAELLDSLFERPYTDVSDVQKRLSVSQPTAGGLVSDLTRARILEETTGRSWGRVFRYTAYLDILREGTAPEPDSGR